jgi:hypothetical protein
MKNLCAVLALTLLSCAWGQDAPKGIYQFPNVEFEHCTDTVYFRGKSKLIKDIFPAECQTETDLRKAVANDPIQIPAPEPPGCRTVYTVESGKTTSGEPILECPVPEPPDVPAIKKTRPASHPCNVDTGNLTMCMTAPEDYWTCENTTRILLTAEDGKKWCHKVQP